MKKAEMLQLKKDYADWEAQLSELEAQLPEKRSAVFVLQTREMKGDRNPTELAKAQQELTDLSQKIEAAKDKMAGIKDLIRGEETKALEDEMASTEAMWKELKQERDARLEAIGDHTGIAAFLLDCYCKKADPDRFIDVTLTGTGFHVGGQTRFHDRGLAAYGEAAEKAKTAFPEAQSYWSRVHALRNLELLKKGTHKVFEEEVRRRVDDFLRS